MKTKETRMTQDEVIELARQAKMDVREGRDGPFDIYATEHTIEAFAKLVAEKERERICEFLIQLNDAGVVIRQYIREMGRK
jgi:hypothetical protein